MLRRNDLIISEDGTGDLLDGFAFQNPITFLSPDLVTDKFHFISSLEGWLRIY
jgi:hypothetical protein